MKLSFPSHSRSLLTAALLSLALATHAAPPDHSGTLTLLLPTEPTALVTVSNVATPILSVSAKVTEGLLKYDYSVNPQPQLATKWAISPDGLTYTFNLRQGVKWHDGQPFGAADVAYSIQELKRVNPRARSTFANVERVETPDAHTAVIVLSAPAPYLLRTLSAAESPIVPKHVYERGEAAIAQNANAPIGTGPFRFKQWVRGAYAEFERNPDYWDSGKPYLDRIIYRFSSDPAAIAAALETGAADFSTAVALADIARLKKNPRLQAQALPSNYLNNIAAIEFNLGNEFFAQAPVRRAVAHAINIELLNKVAYHQYAQPLASPIPATLAPFHDPALKGYAHDIAAANTLLDQAGFKRASDGKRFAVTLDYFPTPTLKQVAEYVKAALSRVGIHVTVRSQDLGGFVQRVYTRRDFDFEINGVGALFDPTVGVQRLYASRDAGKGIPFVNAAGYRNAQVDALLAQSAVEPDEARRVAQFRQFQQIVMQELPLLPLVAVPRGNVWNQRVQGLLQGVEGSAGSFADAWLAPAAR